MLRAIRSIVVNLGSVIKIPRQENGIFHLLHSLRHPWPAHLLILVLPLPCSRTKMTPPLEHRAFLLANKIGLGHAYTKTIILPSLLSTNNASVIKLYNNYLPCPTIRRNTPRENLCFFSKVIKPGFYSTWNVYTRPIPMYLRSRSISWSIPIMA